MRIHNQILESEPNGDIPVVLKAKIEERNGISRKLGQKRGMEMLFA